MADSQNMMKWPLIAAALLVVLRIPLELAGAPGAVTNLFGVAWLYFLVPVYFGFKIAQGVDGSRFGVLFRKLLTFNFLTRLMVMPTYWLAFALGWSAPRFALQNGGVVGDGVSPFEGLLVVPVRNLILWTVLATVVGMIIGSVVLAVKNRSAAATG